MESTARSATSRVLLLVLIPCALASLAGGGLLVGERLGMVALRRTPLVILLPTWDDQVGEAVAIVNTDTTPGSFLLVCGEAEAGKAQQVWVPPRSIVLRRGPDETAFAAALYRGRVQDESRRVFQNGSQYTAPPRFVSRGTAAPIEWPKKQQNAGTAFFEIVKLPGVSLVLAPGLTIAGERRFWASAYNGPMWDPAIRTTDDSDRGASIPPWRVWTNYTWDGSKPVMVEVDSTTPAPSVFEAWAYCSEYNIDVPSRVLVIHDPDMNVIDERDSR